MALNSSLGFAQFAHREHLIHDFLSTVEPPPAPPTLQELRSQRKAKKRQLRELQSLSPEQIEFAAPAISRQTEDLKSLEDQMREALGIDKPAPQERPELLLASFEFQTIPSITPPTPGIEQASETAKRQAALEKELRVTLGVPTPSIPAVPTRKHVERRPLFKRQLEVILQVRDADWREIPFYHSEFNMTAVEAEIEAGKKARRLGLKVLKHIKTTSKEIEYTVGAARA
jgi:hypothetical protein